MIEYSSICNVCIPGHGGIKPSEDECRRCIASYRLRLKMEAKGQRELDGGVYATPMSLVPPEQRRITKIVK